MKTIFFEQVAGLAITGTCKSISNRTKVVRSPCLFYWRVQYHDFYINYCTSIHFIAFVKLYEA